MHPFQRPIGRWESGRNLYSPQRPGPNYPRASAVEISSPLRFYDDRIGRGPRTETDDRWVGRCDLSPRMITPAFVDRIRFDAEDDDITLDEAMAAAEIAEADESELKVRKRKKKDAIEARRAKKRAEKAAKFQAESESRAAAFHALYPRRAR